MTRTLTIAAIQPALQRGAFEANLARLERLVRDAHAAHAPDLIVLPEAITTPNIYHRSCRGASQMDGSARQLLTGLAAELGCAISGGFLARRDGDVFGTYLLAEPDGTTHLHDKDQPTAWENHFYRGGTDEGLIEAFGVPLGLTSGWELGRGRTAARLLRHQSQLVINGMCWPALPVNWFGVVGQYTRREQREQERIAREMPIHMARMVGAPVVMASHVGPITSDTPGLPGVPYRTQMVGQTAIYERDGSVLALLDYADGEGHIAAQVVLDEPEPLDDIPDSFWHVNLRLPMNATWDITNLYGALDYNLRRRFGRHITA